MLNHHLIYFQSFILAISCSRITKQKIVIKPTYELLVCPMVKLLRLWKPLQQKSKYLILYADHRDICHIF